MAMGWKIEVTLACGDTVYRSATMPICAGYETPEAYIAWLETFSAKRGAPGLRPVSWQPVAPMQPSAEQVIVGFIDRHRMPGSPTGAQVGFAQKRAAAQKRRQRGAAYPILPKSGRGGHA